ncbi:MULTISPECIES: hypothetical protein [Lysobacteraceae]|uniref:hypothetical protein n=1 Tax=Lysobacteraceae TaxID=32033 RepID=UPI000AAE89DA|nr:MULTISPECIES: hypothetical protein [Stenotrophomonas]MBH1476794.1 hypothetical protein [Stenotrophomonas maltophilia]MBH1502311.1 hypothetical protein [Stenotrophomonas maltophilia]HEL7888390.1 hypothetical protein [Stenotrophomonas maltophilia]
MDWEYTYRAATARHRPTGLVFRIAYNSTAPGWVISLEGERLPSVEAAHVAALRDELHQLVHDAHTQRRVSELLHGPYNGDYSHVAAILSRQTRKKVSVRTLQAWMMPAGRPSSRRCPEWALLALEQYLASNPRAPADWQETSSILRSTPSGQTLAFHTQLRDQRSLQLAEAEIAEEEATLHKWRSADLMELAQRLTEMEISSRRATSNHADMIGQIVALTRSCATFEEFRAQLDEALRRKLDLDYTVRQIVSDLRKGRGEFASPDGTLPE